MDILAFGAHPDDVELSCGGTLLKLAKKGLQTGIIDLTMAELSTEGNPQRRRKEAEAAARILKISERQNLKIPDGGIENKEAYRLLVIDAIRKYRPGLVFAPYPYDRHPDHGNASQLVSDSCFYAGLEKIKTGHEAYRPVTVIYYYQHWVEQPVFIVDISEDFETKMKAVQAYKSQFVHDAKGKSTFINRSEFLQSVKNRAEYFGYQINAQYGEPFFIRLPMKINNIMDLFT